MVRPSSSLSVPGMLTRSLVQDWTVHHKELYRLQCDFVFDCSRHRDPANNDSSCCRSSSAAPPRNNHFNHRIRKLAGDSVSTHLVRNSDSVHLMAIRVLVSSRTSVLHLASALAFHARLSQHQSGRLGIFQDALEYDCDVQTAPDSHSVLTNLIHNFVLLHRILDDTYVFIGRAAVPLLDRCHWPVCLGWYCGNSNGSSV